MSNGKQTFKEWMAEVGKCVDSETEGEISVYDLSDYAYRDAFERGDSPLDVALEVLEDNGWEV